MAAPTSPGETVLNATQSAPVAFDGSPESPAPEATQVPEEPLKVSGVASATVPPDVSIARLVARNDPSQAHKRSTQPGIWHPGLQDGDLLAAPVMMTGLSADLAEESPVIPLPNSAWTGLTMLALLAIVRFFRKFRRSLA